MLTTDDYHACDDIISNDKGIHIFPCKYCHGRKMKNILIIYQHMIRYGHSGISPSDENNYPYMIELHSMRD